MTRLLLYRFLNLTLRGLTIFLKFILSVLVIKKLSIEDYGELGLFQSTIIIMTFIVSFDFYTFSSREILKKGSKTFNYYFTNQLIFHAFAYIITLPFSLIIFQLGIIDLEYFGSFVLLLIAEHLSQEFYRLLILLNKTVVATILVFLRSGMWIIVLYLFWNYQLIDQNIYSVIILWLIGAFLSVVYGLRFIKLKRLKQIDYKWIIIGLKASLPFFLGTVLYKITEFSGRYFLSFYSTEEEVGIYTFFSSIANILFVFVHTLVLIEVYPKLLKAKNEGSKIFIQVLVFFKKQVLEYSFLGLVLSLILIYPLLLFLDKIPLFKNVLSYIALLISTFLFCTSFVYHYALYAHNKDILILKATILSFITNICCSFLLIPRLGVLGASLAILMSFLVILIVKLNYWKKLKLYT